MFNFTPLLGARTVSPASQSLLEFEGGVKILIDVGWDSDFDLSQLEALSREAPTLSLILLTHATPSHIAAFAHCCKHIPSFKQIPVYATQPVIYLGRTLLQDIYSSTPLVASAVPQTYPQSSSKTSEHPQILLQPPSRDEIASYFHSIHPLKYSQPHEPLASAFSPPLHGLTITAYNAGHSLGGTIWHITHGMESVVYAVDWNQVRENVYNRAAWLTGGGGAEIVEQLQKPTALVCSTRGVERMPLAGGRDARDKLLLERIRSALAQGGTVLIPTDACARVLELVYVIEHAWRRQAISEEDHPFKIAKVYVASKTMNTTLRYARSMVEWMDDNISREAEADPAANAMTFMNSNQKSNAMGNGFGNKPGPKSGPFDLKYIKVVERKYQMEKLLSKNGPKVIIASEASLAWGFSKDVFVNIAADPNSLVILTDAHASSMKAQQRASSSIGQVLWKWFREHSSPSTAPLSSIDPLTEPVSIDGRSLTYEEPVRVSLEGSELEVYQQHLLTQRQLSDAVVTGEDPSVEAGADLANEAASASSSESEETDSEQQGRALNFSNAVSQATRAKTAGKEAFGVNALLSQANMFDYDVRGRKGRESLFPFVGKRHRGDEFGELIRPEDYLRAEERDEAEDAISGQEDNDGHELGQKRKWADLDVINTSTKQASKRSRHQKFDVQVNSPDSDTGDTFSDAESRQDKDEEEFEDAFARPSKLLLKDCSVDVRLRVAYVDFTGLHDQRNMSLLIPLIKPRKVILVGGDDSSTQWLANECREKLLPGTQLQGNSLTMLHANDLLTPSNGQLVEASMDANAWTVKISERLVRRIQWQKVGGREVVTLTGSLGAGLTDDDAGPQLQRQKRQKLSEDDAHKQDDDDTTEALKHGEKDDNSHSPPILDVLPAAILGTTRTVAQSLHVGDLRLADLRKMLLSEGYSAEFRGQGTLVVDGRVAVRKSAGGTLEVESAEGLGEKDDFSRRREMPFYAIRRRIYEGLAVIAGQ